MSLSLVEGTQGLLYSNSTRLLTIVLDRAAYEFENVPLCVVEDFLYRDQSIASFFRHRLVRSFPHRELGAKQEQQVRAQLFSGCP